MITEPKGADRFANLSFTLEPIMKVMIFVKSNPSLEKNIEEMSDSALKESMAKMKAFNEELKEAGVMKDCNGLRPSREGKRVRFDGPSRSVFDGPFEGDLVAGYWVWELPSSALFALICVGRFGRCSKILSGLPSCPMVAPTYVWRNFTTCVSM
jgi:hypothetical protein